jgi:serralysin
MTLRPTRLIAAAAASAALSLAPAVLLGTTATAGQPAGYGPSDPFDDALMGDGGPVLPLKNQGIIERTRYGYRLTIGQQDSHLAVTLVDGRLRFKDTGTRSWRGLPRACKAERVPTGIAATCRVPASTSDADPTLLEIRPRLGNDYVDARTLPAVFELAVLADAGNDTVLTGAGNDFINGAQNRDEVHGGGGNDWIRTGIGNDKIWGDDGNDYLVGSAGRDTIDGGAGVNRIFN